MRFRQKIAASASFACLISLAACALQPATLDATASTYAETSSSKTSAKYLRDVQIVSLSDDRGKDAMLTDLQGRPMDGADVMDWLYSSFERRGASIIDAETRDAEYSASCALDVALKRAHTDAKHGASKVATVVLAVREAGSDVPYQYLRGNNATMNWAGSSGETNFALSRALDNASKKMIGFCEDAE